jgi:hypothetical protein
MSETRSQPFVPHGQGSTSVSASARFPAPSALAAAWYQAVQDSTACLVQHGNNSNHKDGNDDNKEQVAACMAYLFQLESLLQPLEPLWDQPPPFAPPPFRPVVESEQGHDRTSDYLYHQANTNGSKAQGGIPVDTRSPVQDIPDKVSSPTPAYLQNNPYAGIHDDDDDDDEAGDFPTWSPDAVPEALSSGSPQNDDSSSSSILNMRRLLIRILTTQSDLYAYLARDCRRNSNWSTGADHCLAAVQRIHQAIMLADSEISRLWNNQENTSTEADSTPAVVLEGLVEDADTCQVAVQHLTQEKDRFQQAAERQATYLTKKLEPQWATRDEVKTRMGDDKWRNNPRPKHDYAAQRRALEQELRDIQPALEKLGALDTGALVQSAQALQQRLGKNQDVAWTSQQRYNGERPTDTSRRVDIDHYPDPEVFGWTFTGSWDNMVEFFEKSGDAGVGGVVKLDWYFTTGTVKTSMDHIRQGKTQLFGAKVNPEVYADILINPRSHTNERYHTRDQRPTHRGRGRGRGFGRGRGHGIRQE